MAKDILLDEDNKLRIEDGDYVVGDSEGQEVRLLLFSMPGNWRQNPLAGIGIRRMINVKVSASEMLTFKRNITLQVNGDGKRVKQLVITKGKFKIDYE